MKNARRRLGRDPAATLPGCDLFAGAHTAHSRIPSPFPSARPHFFGSIANFVPKRAWHPPNANPAHSKASHCDGLNFVGCHDLRYQGCETILAFLSGHRNSSTRPAHLASEWRSALVSGGRARSCTRLASTPVSPFRGFATAYAALGRRSTREPALLLFLQRPRPTSLSVTTIPSSCCRVMVYL